MEAPRERATELSGSTTLLNKRGEGQFLLDYIENVVFVNYEVSIQGRIPSSG